MGGETSGRRRRRRPCYRRCRRRLPLRSNRCPGGRARRRPDSRQNRPRTRQPAPPAIHSQPPSNPVCCPPSPPQKIWAKPGEAAAARLAAGNSQSVNSVVSRSGRLPLLLPVGEGLGDVALHEEAAGRALLAEGLGLLRQGDRLVVLPLRGQELRLDEQVEPVLFERERLVDVGQTRVV